MATLTDAREALAAAVSESGLVCEPYAPDNPTPPTSWVDALSVDYVQGSGFSFCLAGAGSATVITVGQRHDRVASTRALEELVPAILESLGAVDGVRVAGIQSGSVQVTGQEYPSVMFNVEFAITG